MLGALIVGQGQCAGGGSSNGEWIHQAKDVTAHGLGCWGDAAKHIFELSTLLKQDRQWGLACLKADRDVGELRR
ncbi:hypothetical protein D3C77_279040 [compost metagenome]